MSGSSLPEQSVSEEVASSVAALFRAGERLGRDPMNQTVRDGPAITGERSQWLGSYCRECYHNFRLDDPVLVRTDQSGRIVEVVHDFDIFSWCMGGNPDPGRADMSELGREFFAGIDSEDPPRVKHVRRLSAEDELVQLRDAVLDRNRRRRCFVCTQTFRPHELVIDCVCHPGERQCALAVHRDAAHNLLCYERYLQAHGRVRQCPTDGHIPGQS